MKPTRFTTSHKVAIAAMLVAAVIFMVLLILFTAPDK
jgi:hypothetical protein